jgi:regulatory protein
VKWILPKRAKLRSMNLLKARDYTEAQLRNKLRDGYYPQTVIDQAVEYAASFHYIDDLRYALGYIAYWEKTHSRRMIEQKLWQKGIGKGTIEKAWTQWEEKGGSQDEGDMVKKLMGKRHYHPAVANDKEKRKMCSYLLRKGFEAELVNKALQ